MTTRFKNPETKQPYSLKKVVLEGSALSTRSWEYAVDQELAKDRANGGTRMGVMVPFDAFLTRSDISATGGASLGADLVESQLQPSILGSLFPHSACAKFGAQIFTGLKGNFVYPYKSVASNIYQPSGENVPVSVDSSTQFSQTVLNPQRITTELWVSRQLLLQSHDRQVEAFLARELWRGLAAQLDGLAITGNATGYAPITGLLNNSSLSTISFSGSVSWSNIQTMIYNVSNLNFGMGNRGWVTSPATLEKLATVQKISGSNFPSFIYDRDTKTIAGFPVAETTNVTGNQLVHGKWDEMALCFWGEAIDLVSDPFTYGSQNIIRLVANIMANSGALRPGFCVSTNAANS